MGTGFPIKDHAPPKSKESTMPQSDISSDLREELRAAAVEPLLPIEKKLIGWSLSLGLVLLVVLAVINHFFPAAP
jgi:hypothetical protein